MSEKPKLIIPRTHWRYWADELALQIIETQGAMALAGMAGDHAAAATLRSLQDGMLRRLQGLLTLAGDDTLPAYQFGLEMAGEVTHDRPNDARWAVNVRGPFSWLPGTSLAGAPAAEAVTGEGGAAARPSGRRRDLYVPVTRKVSLKNETRRGPA